VVYEGNQSCDHCRSAIYSCEYNRLIFISESFVRHGSLYKCSRCNSYWEILERYAVVVNINDIKKYYAIEI
jgi:hypothetical protein